MLRVEREKEFLETVFVVGGRWSLLSGCNV